MDQFKFAKIAVVGRKRRAGEVFGLGAVLVSLQCPSWELQAERLNNRHAFSHILQADRVDFWCCLLAAREMRASVGESGEIDFSLRCTNA